MERLLSHHEHPVLSVLPHILVHVQGRHRHVDSTGQKLHLQENKASGKRYSFNVYFSWGSVASEKAKG